MANFYYTSFVLFFILALSASDAIENRRFGGQRLQQRKRIVFARQELAPAVTPYPSAEELKPSVPFEEEIASTQPEEVYGPPEQAYGPPNDQPTTTESLPAAEQLPSAEAPEEFAPNPDAEEFEPVTSSRFTQARRRPAVKRIASARLQLKQRQQKVSKTQRLIAPPAPAPAVPFVFPSPVQTQQYYVLNQQQFAPLQAW